MTILSELLTALVLYGLPRRFDSWIPVWALFTFHWEVSSESNLLKLLGIDWARYIGDIRVWCPSAIDSHASLRLVGMRVERSHVLNVALSYFGLRAHTNISLPHCAFPFAFRLFKELLVWSNQSPVYGVGSLLYIDEPWLTIILLLIESCKLASLATPDRWVLTSSLDALLGNRSSHKWLVCHGFHRLLVILHTFLVVEELWLTV